jgi:hypothetical protein
MFQTNSGPITCEQIIEEIGGGGGGSSSSSSSSK